MRLARAARPDSMSYSRFAAAGGKRLERPRGAQRRARPGWCARSRRWRSARPATPVGAGARTGGQRPRTRPRRPAPRGRAGRAGPSPRPARRSPPARGARRGGRPGAPPRAVARRSSIAPPRPGPARRNRTFQARPRPALTVLKTGWATGPVPLSQVPWGTRPSSQPPGSASRLPGNGGQEGSNDVPAGGYGGWAWRSSNHRRSPPRPSRRGWRRDFRAVVGQDAWSVPSWPAPTSRSATLLAVVVLRGTEREVCGATIPVTDHGRSVHRSA